MNELNYPESVLTPEELKAGRDRIAAANINNVLHHCRKCDYEWVATHAEACRCGSKSVERIMCWQFPDDQNAIACYVAVKMNIEICDEYWV